MRIVDLSMPIGPHFRWGPEVQVKGDIGAGDPFRVTRLSTTCHGFTHVDAMAHFVAAAPTIEATPLDRVVGPCRILDLRDAAPNEAIGPERLAAADLGGPEGEILLLSAGWDRQSRPPSPSTSRRTTPSGSSSTASWRRETSTSRMWCCSIEYLVNTSALAGPRTILCAAPLKIPTADGAPARAFAIEGLATG